MEKPCINCDTPEYCCEKNNCLHNAISRKFEAEQFEKELEELNVPELAKEKDTSDVKIGKQDLKEILKTAIKN